jgi:hypothetical protein
MVGAAVFTSQQVADAPSGLYNSIKLSVTTADTSIAASDTYPLSFLLRDTNWRILTGGLPVPCLRP